MEYSALIPAFNAAATITAAIESILGQTVPPQEIIVVDDGSTDGTGDIAASYDARVRVIHQENRGVGSATSVALKEATCPLLASLDADDIWLPTKMSEQLAHLSAIPACTFVFSHLRNFRDDGVDTDVIGPGWSRTTMTAHTSAAREIGDMIDPPGGRGEMIDWLARGRHKGFRMDMLKAVLALRRIHPGSLSYGRSSEKDRGYGRVAWLAVQRARNRMK